MKIGHLNVSFSIKSDLPAKVWRIVRFPRDLYANIRALSKRSGVSFIEVINESVALNKWTLDNVIAPELRLCAVTKRGIITTELVFQKKEV
jgi:hypothetical protein